MPDARHSLHQAGAILPQAPEGVRLRVLTLLNTSGCTSPPSQTGLRKASSQQIEAKHALGPALCLWGIFRCKWPERSRSDPSLSLCTGKEHDFGLTDIMLERSSGRGFFSFHRHFKKKPALLGAQPVVPAALSH
ncbi:hypothetical protein mRhiFer1_008985 [Rhinolophus ferrumequinum]|uniref:Uncharacterized protein n=1 Tax=Rhinolophus ferrumequinum TaxID=59479 RepID=A0A7J7TF11_RHIFE|nr:hypothetical protein mRhiFer1_008985 [Rhinolophus ferrumequinum]